MTPVPARVIIGLDVGTTGVKAAALAGCVTFGSALGGELMAEALDRPVRVVGDKEGTALGASALGLVAVGAAPDLDDALVLLGGVSTGSPVTASAEQVALFAGLRDRVARLLAALDRTINAVPAVPTPVEP